MSRLTQQEIRNNAVSFVHEWKDESRERAESQTFWNEFLDIFGVKRRQVAVFEKAVKKNNQNTGAIDLFWKGVLLAEHKSRGKNLDKAASQAFEYLENLPENDLPEIVLISDFSKFRLFNLDSKEEIEFPLAELPNRIQLFGAISGYQKREYKEQDAVNIAVALKVGELHDALLASGYDGHKLEVFLVRLVYCLFADDTGIFLPRSVFLYFLEEKTAENGSNLGAMLNLLFQILDTPETNRQSTIDEDLRQFPYVNGELFSERMDLPFFDKKMRQILIEACSFDWSKVSPAIFGSLFQSVMDASKRRNLGAHYTSEKNILKVIRGLFLDELYAELSSIKNNQNKLREFHNKLSRLKFFDPACGCGNFLVITYREIRNLEIEVLKQLRELTGKGQVLDVGLLSLIDVDSFYGIETEEFPAEIARVALWLTDHQANMNLSAEFGLSFVRLPLRKSANIVHGNALRIDWSEVVSCEGNKFETQLYILGNPPFVGGKMMGADQRADMAQVCKDVPNFGLLDYVCAWYVKAVKFAENSRIKIAFVSTNSITQGEQVGVLWQYLLDKGVKIHFAHRTFKWTNEASGKAAVYCVIVGFALFDINRKRLFDYETPIAESHEIEVKNINPYLIDSADVVILRRQNPLSNIPGMNFGNMPLDGGNLIISSFEEKQELLNKNTNLEKYIKGFTGADEFINGKERWCLWFDKIQPTELRTMPDEIKKRIEAVKLFRENSKAPSTRKFAETPYLFRDRNLPNKYLLIPSVSSERRKYVPIGFLTSEVVTSNLCLIVPNATLYHFGVLTSIMHNAWMRQVCGRLESRYRYSKEIVYNNFPFPKSPTQKQIERVERTAQGILDARLKFPGATLADLYDPLTMPKELLDAHRANDEAVDACYGKQRFKNELERLEFLFDLYRKYTEPLAVIEEKETRKAKRRK
ncbi:MAG: class I SAM-dependent DNA methyltransferase, partial [Acidobacteriota bacterium]|nr:class I SAM-dependent DNA methyltransferase [Acidobacteriota bacterium]